MNAHEVINSMKVGVAVMLGFIGVHVGGFDNIFKLLALLIITDYITGVVKAIIRKDLASRELFLGAIRKCLILVCITICCEFDIVVSDFVPADKIMFSARLCAIVYFIIEEQVSIIENLRVIGLPLPSWLEAIFRNLSQTTNSTPTALFKIISAITGQKFDKLVGEVTKKESINNIDENTDYID